MRGNVDLVAVQVRLIVELLISDYWEQSLRRLLIYTRLVIGLIRIRKGNEPLIIVKDKLWLVHLWVGKSVCWRLKSFLKFINRLWFPIYLRLNTLDSFSDSAHSLELYDLGGFFSQSLSFTLSVMNLLQHSFNTNRAILRIADELGRFKEVRLKLGFVGRRRIRFLGAILFKGLVVHFNYIYFFQSLTFVIKFNVPCKEPKTFGFVR